MRFREIFRIKYKGPIPVKSVGPINNLLELRKERLRKGAEVVVGNAVKPLKVTKKSFFKKTVKSIVGRLPLVKRLVVGKAGIALTGGLIGIKIGNDARKVYINHKGAVRNATDSAARNLWQGALDENNAQLKRHFSERKYVLFSRKGTPVFTNRGKILGTGRDRVPTINAKQRIPPVIPRIKAEIGETPPIINQQKNISPKLKNK